MNRTTPRVSIGLPVFNGERFLEATLQSITAQTFGDFELVICDNASTDRTEEIARKYAGLDNRVRYFRNEKNLGLSANYTRAFELTTAPYFRWATYDDLIHPEFLARCVEVLDTDPSVVLVHSRSKKIDANGAVTGQFDYEMNLLSNSPRERFQDLVMVRHSCNESLGLIRRSVLTRTPLQANFVGSDRVLVAELALYGRINVLPAYLFYRRDHADTGSNIPMQQRTNWFDPGSVGQIKLPNLREVFEYSRAVYRANPPVKDRVACYVTILQYAAARRRLLLSEVRYGFASLLLRIGFLRRIRLGFHRRSSQRTSGTLQG